MAWFRGPALVALMLSLAVLAPAPGGSRAVAAMTAPASQRTAAATRSPAQRMAGLPLTFERNDGQVSSRVKYLARGPGYTLFLTDEGATLVLARPVSMGHRAAVLEGRQGVAGLLSHAGQLSRPRMAEAVLRLTPVGMGRPQIIAANRQPGVVNYLIGNNPRRWHTSIPTYREAVYRQVYPGIDLVFAGRPGGGLEYSWLVRAGADAGAIRLQLAGSGMPALSSQGRLVWHTGAGALVQGQPVVYQRLAGRRVAVAGRFVLHGRVLRLVLGRYDHRQPLVIDPTLAPVYSTYLGGGVYDDAYGIAVDGAGHAYVTGRTASTNFPTTSGALQTSHHGGLDDAFVTELNPTGSGLVYSTYLGGSFSDYANGIAVDGLGHAYVAGQTASPDFPTTPGGFQTILHVGFQDAFVSELSTTGSGLVYSTYLGGIGAGDIAHGIALDGAGHAYVTGETFSANFPITPGAFQTTNGGGKDAFVTELNSTGSGLVYSTYLGGSGFDVGLASRWTGRATPM